MMTLETVVKALIAKFGEGNYVKTKDALTYIESIGLTPRHYYSDLRDTYGVAHGTLCFGQPKQPEEIVTAEETEEQIADRINERFDALDIMSRATAKGINRCLMLSGPAGLGKSHGVEMAANEVCRDFAHIKGYVRATGLYKTLYKNRKPGQLIIFDDADSLFNDDTCLNLLKAACDSSAVRKMSWLTSVEMEDEDGEQIPSTFEYEGSIIFITNIDFAAAVEKGSKLAPHFEALMSRSHYLDLAIKDRRDYIVRIKQVMRNGNMLDDVLSKDEKEDIISFIEDNAAKMRELSLRMVKKLADLMLMDRNSWKKLAKITCMK